MASETVNLPVRDVASLLMVYECWIQDQERPDGPRVGLSPGRACAESIAIRKRIAEHVKRALMRNDGPN